MPSVSTKQVRPEGIHPFLMVTTHEPRHTYGLKNGTNRRVLFSDRVRFGGELVSYSTVLKPNIANIHLKPSITTEKL